MVLGSDLLGPRACARRVTRVGPLVLVALVVPVAVALAAGSPAAGQSDTSAGGTADPQEIYLRDCAVCHGADGHGTNRGPTLVDVGAASVDYWVSTGRMPLVRDPARNPVTRDLQPLPGVQLFETDVVPERHDPAYPPQVIRALVDYVAVLAGGGPPIPDVRPSSAGVPQGGQLFRQQCAACHAWAGDGGALLHREAPSLHNATATQIAEAIRIGPGTMPAFGRAALSVRQLNDVTAYVRYLDRPKDRGGWSIWHLGPVAEGGIVWVLGVGALILAIRWMGETT